jgi:hypothetical protein
LKVAAVEEAAAAVVGGQGGRPVGRYVGDFFLFHKIVFAES